MARSGRFCEPNTAAAAVGACILWIEFDRVIIIGQGAVVILLVEPDVTAADVCVGTLRVEPDRVAIVGDSTVMVPVGEPGHSEVHISIGVVLGFTGVGDDLRAATNGAVRILLLPAIFPIAFVGRNRRCRGQKQEAERDIEAHTSDHDLSPTRSMADWLSHARVSASARHVRSAYLAGYRGRD